ncbi:MAG: carboxypeptidase-like regulatory domain-containing protein, partial [Gemmatimonadaceae bacterium]
MSPSHYHRATLLAAVVAAFATTTVAAQGTDAAIRGIVTDSTGAPIAGASIEVRHTSSNFVAQLTTSAQGRYVATQLPLGGPYRLTVRAVGYSPVAREGLMLNLGSTATADFRV